MTLLFVCAAATTTLALLNIMQRTSRSRITINYMSYIMLLITIPRGVAATQCASKFARVYFGWLSVSEYTAITIWAVYTYCIALSNPTTILFLKIRGRIQTTRTTPDKYIVAIKVLALFAAATMPAVQLLTST
jgi:hypothetical protein